MRIEEDLKLDYSDVLIRPKRSTLVSRQRVALDRTFRFRHGTAEWRGVPIIAANMDTIGTMPMARALAAHHCLTALHKHYDIDTLVDFYAGLSEAERPYVLYSLGITEADREKWEAVKVKLGNQQRPFGFCIDVANGYSEVFDDFVAQFREDNPDTLIMAGNVVTGEMVEQLVLNGADIVKVGIGPGSVCTTRKMTGVGYPQLSAVIECADAGHGLKGLVCADGGCTNAGDVAKAFGAGADFVMLGGMFAGHDECNGEIVYANLTVEERAMIDSEASSSDEVEKLLAHKRKSMKFYGMSSATAMNKHAGGVAAYRAPEGKTVEVPYRGPVENTILEILGGVRSACTYVGATRLKELSKRTTFVRVNNQRNFIFGSE